MSRREKQYRSLDVLESDFRRAFIAELEMTAQHDTIWAYVMREPVSYQAEPWFRARCETHLLEQVEEIEKLRATLGEPAAGTIAELYRNFCRSLVDTQDEQRLGPRRLALRLLEQLKTQ